MSVQSPAQEPPICARQFETISPVIALNRYSRKASDASEPRLFEFKIQELNSMMINRVEMKESIVKQESIVQFPHIFVKHGQETSFGPHVTNNPCSPESEYFHQLLASSARFISTQCSALA